MQSLRVYFNNIGSICTDSLRHGNGLSALLLLTRAPKSSAAKSSASKTRSMESRLNLYPLLREHTCALPVRGELVTLVTAARVRASHILTRRWLAAPAYVRYPCALVSIWIVSSMMRYHLPDSNELSINRNGYSSIKAIAIFKKKKFQYVTFYNILSIDHWIGITICLACYRR